ncbi:MAG: hypothetical protein J6N52_12510 [Clostridia bacterium]|nr:hypothetical protein [Clostridia bacterium]
MSYEKSRLYPNQLLQPTGALTGSPQGREWLKTQQTQVLVDQLWRENIAFADGASGMWVKNHIEDIETPAIMEREHRRFRIPAQIAGRVFNINTSQDWISSDEIAAEKGLYTFFDPRGFLMFSQCENAVDTNDYDSIFKSYHDSFNVIAAIGTLHWHDVCMTDAELAVYRGNWLKSLLGKEYFNDPRFHEELGRIPERAAEWRSLLYYGENNRGPFTDALLDCDPNENTGKAKMQTVLTRLVDMAKAWHIGDRKDNGLLEDIFSAFEYVYSAYSREIRLIDGTPSWPAYTINAPHAYANLLLLLYDVMIDAEIKKHTNAIFDRLPDPTITRGIRVSESINPLTFVNRLWATQAYLNAAVLAKDHIRINYAMRYINEAFEPSYRYSCDYLLMSPDGFHEDGSMIFHGMNAYNTGYGRSYAIMVTNFLLLSENTSVDIRNVYNFKNVYDFAEYGLLQFTADGSILKMTTGRHFPNEAYKLLVNVIPIINRAEPQRRKKLSELMLCEIKNDIDTYKNCPGLGGWSSGGFIRAVETDRFLKSAEGLSEKQKRSDSVYNAMNKAIHCGAGFKACIAMSSARINKFEYFGGEEGKNDWYINDGAMLIYNGDCRQFTRNWLESVNPYYIPGTTVDSTHREPVLTIDWRNARADNEWAGGVSDGECGTVSMVLGNKFVSGLRGKKSWFMYGDKILCMGSAIEGGFGLVYTTLDNRIAAENESIYTSEGNLHPYDEIKKICGSYVNFNNKIGYTVLKGGVIQAEFERTDRLFAKAYIVHGENPDDGSYAYAVLPGCDEKQTADYNAFSDFTIMELSNDRHIVRIMENNIIMASLFAPGDLEGFRFLTPCQVLLDMKKMRLFISDPAVTGEAIRIGLPDGIRVKNEAYTKHQSSTVLIDTSQNRCGIYRLILESA